MDEMGSSNRFIRNRLNDMTDCRCGSKFCSDCNPECGTPEEDGIVTINLTDETYDALMRIFVEENLRRESISTFRDYIDQGCNTTEALAHAVINEMALRAFIDMAERKEFEEKLNNKQDNNDNKNP